MTIRELSTQQRSDWIERIFARLNSIYGKDFAYKWEDANVEEMREAWSDTLAGFNGEAIKSALKACGSLPKCPNLPEFAAMCRASMQTRAEFPDVEPVEPVKRSKAAAMIADFAKKMQEKAGAKAEFTINGVPITHYKRWTYALILREADGGQIDYESAKAWREVLGFSKETTPEQAMKTKKEIAN